ncbi:MAG TPA: DUF4097 family beta strand repeat-containing protein, partial [Stenotrophomonas sp.]
MRMTLALCTLLALPSVALAADDHCKASEPRNLKLDLAGVKSVLFEVNSHDLHLQGTPGATGQASGRACASNPELLKKLTLSQRKVGDQLIVTLERESKGWNLSFGDNYAYLDIRANVPDGLPVRLEVGSGDVDAIGLAALDVSTGSGDVNVRDVKGLVTAKVGSGDVTLDRIGALKVGSIGSGDFTAHHVGGTAEVGTLGSGDLDLTDVQGSVKIGVIGSGDVDVSAV